MKIGRAVSVIQWPNFASPPHYFDPEQHVHHHVCYLAEFGRCKSNRFSVSRSPKIAGTLGHIS